MNQVNKRKTYVLITVVVCTVILVLGIVLIMLHKKPDDGNKETQIGTESTTSQGSQTTPAASEETDANQIPETTETTGQGSHETDPSENPSETDPSEDPSETDKPQNNDGNSIRLPYSIPGSGLVIEQFNSYNGLFFEDGSDKAVSNITAMVLTNTGDDYAEYIDITIDRDGVQLKFVGSALAPGGKMVILEASGKQFRNGTYSNCVANVATAAEFTMSENQVRVEENAERGLLVTNITGKDIPYIRIFYKFYMTDSDVYVGGITYTAKVTDLAAGASCTVTPSHYLKGYSKVIMVKTYDTDA